MRAPFLAVASLAVNLRFRSVASNDRIQCLRAVAALEALAMPFATLGQHQLGSEHNTSTSGATLAGGRLNGSGIDYRSLWCLFTVKQIARCEEVAAKQCE